MKTPIKPGDKIYVLNRNAFVGPGERVLEMRIIQKNNELIAVSNHTKFPKQFAVTSKMIQEDNASEHPRLFDTRAEAQTQYETEINQNVQAILDKSKEELLTELFRDWWGEGHAPQPIHNAMVTKIKTEFGVDVLQDF